MSQKIKLEGATKVVFFTGAGMSAESGVPTFRGKGGMWEQYKPQEYACQTAFERDPERVWEFHNMRREVVAGCDPHEGHALIAALEQRLPEVTIVTQNIDGMHQRAGSKKVHELHGSLWHVRCEACGELIPNQEVPFTELHHHCGHYLRPHIVWFGDNLDQDVIQASLMAIAECEVLVSIGTSALVYPAAEFPLIAKRAGAALIEINPEDTPLSDAFDIKLRGPASAMLKQLTFA